MQNQKTLIVFDQERAAAYDQDAAKLAPLVEALHFLIRLILADLPADARILCVGAGTGTELINLAQTFPQWHFTAVEPAAPMLDICRQRAEECGIASRCTFHEILIRYPPRSYSMRQPVWWFLTLLCSEKTAAIFSVKLLPDFA
jgi:tRNA (cmo5U34)-methyltransferase